MKCSATCEEFNKYKNSENIGYCKYAENDQDDPLDGLVRVGCECEKGNICGTSQQ